MFEQIAAWSSILGAVIGVPSLIFSIRAFSEAKRAKIASNRAEEQATAAHSALRNLRAAEGLQYLSSRASELLILLESSRYDVAHYVARELRFELNRVIKHWDFLEAAITLRLKDTGNQLKTITDFLHSRSEVTPEQKIILMAQSDEISNALRSETGKIQALIESRQQ